MDDFESSGGLFLFLAYALIGLVGASVVSCAVVSLCLMVADAWRSVVARFGRH